jgi:hypothetical protein
MTIGAYDAAFKSWPSASTVKMRSRPAIVPVGRLTFDDCTAVTTSSMPMPCADSFRGSTSMRTAYF